MDRIALGEQEFGEIRAVLPRDAGDQCNTRHDEVLVALVNIVQPDDVVLAEVASGLDLDQFEGNLAGIGEAVSRADRDIRRLVLMEYFFDPANRPFRGSTYHDPVLGAVMMLLQRQDAAGSNDQPLDLEALAGIDGFVVPPWAIDAAMVGRLGPRGLLERGDQFFHRLGAFPR